MKKIGFILLITAIFLVGCGGGGKKGGSVGGSTYFETPRAVSTFQPLVGATTEQVILDIFTENLDGVAGDEVIVVGRQSAASPGDPLAFNVRVFGWTTGRLADETALWFNSGDNIIIGSEPSVQFGNFNNDGAPDMVIAAGTDDPNFTGKTMVFLSDPSNTQFIKTEIGNRNLWSHGSVVHDLNNDNIDDIIVVGYGAGGISVAINDGAGNFAVTEFAGSASGVSVGDYVAGGNLEVVLTDNNNAGNNAQDTWMYELNASTTPPTLTRLSRLPDSILVNSHAIRNIAMDFNGDTVTDVVVFERQQFVGGGGALQSVVQFLKNNNDGTFTDVTDVTLVGYDTSNGGVNYQPVIYDFDGDMLDDIFLSGQDFNNEYTQTQILMQTSIGMFESKYSAAFTAFWNAIKGSSLTGENMHIVNGPGLEPHIASIVISGVNATLYIAKVKTIW